MLIDLHAHTWPRSNDSILNPDDLIVRAKQAGLDALCFTEHDILWEPEALEEIRARHDFLILAGVEISTEDGHMLVFGIDKYVFGMHHVRELARYVESSGGVMVAAHPYRKQMPWFTRGDEEYQQALDKAAKNPAYPYVKALEVQNGRGSDKENEFSQRLAEMMSMKGTAGTDSHMPIDIGKCATQFERTVRNEQDLIAELKAGRFYAVDRRTGQSVIAGSAARG